MRFISSGKKLKAKRYQMWMTVEMVWNYKNCIARIGNEAEPQGVKFFFRCLKDEARTVTSDPEKVL